MTAYLVYSLTSLGRTLPVGGVRASTVARSMLHALFVAVARRQADWI